MQPAFLMIGEMKCGTTSLYRYLERHPDIRPPFQKEPYFFATRYDRGMSWYRSLFPLARGGRVTYEGSVYYLAHPHAPERIRRHLPDAKLIVLLRDPVARTQSHWNHSRSKGREPLGFEAALEAEAARMAGEVERLRADPGYVSHAHINHAYATRSRYVDSLRPWLENFPREQLLVLGSEELFERTAETVDAIQRFVGVRVADLGPYTPFNTRDYDRMDPETRQRLTERFEAPNRELYELLGRDLGWARTGAVI